MDVGADEHAPALGEPDGIRKRDRCMFDPEVFFGKGTWAIRPREAVLSQPWSRSQLDPLAMAVAYSPINASA